MSTQLIPVETAIAGRVPKVESINDWMVLIKQTIEEGDLAHKNANKYYFIAGLYLIKVKPLVLAEVANKNTNKKKKVNPYVYWRKWLSKNFSRTEHTVNQWMKAAKRLEKNGKLLEDVTDSSNTSSTRAYLSELIGSTTLSSVVDPREPGHRPRWHLSVKELLPNQYDITRMRAEHYALQLEKTLQSEMGDRVIEIGYKVLASKLHPDHGGSPEAMVRLNHVRNILKGAL